MSDTIPNTIQIDRNMLRDALGHFATGVAVVTTLGEGGRPVGLTINSFNSVSLSPPLILWSLARTAPSFDAFRNYNAFAINILARDQRDLCMQFARPSEDKFRDIAHRPGIENVPLIDGVHAQLECRTYRRHEGGDHEIYLGEVIGISTFEKQPLVFHRGQFTHLSEAAA
ncbi:flavin reductase family protein [Nitratireductor sp. XY-223]|uniref:flavin reductase family protein n=1 Tax=Nitratireductor sp. XY-223 TaxID=2561926 RepID=UPI0010AAA314|nr:flavin reductase family protein [Nitratireductor sp. XY-223]